MSTKPKPPLLPRACIRKQENKSYCGRDLIEKHEFMFVDAAYAVKHYSNSTVIRACEDCVREAEKAGVASQQFMAPMATRQKENDK